MSVKKIFFTLITIVVCLILGGFIINILIPNATNQLVNSAEDQIYRATGLSFDFNGDKETGKKNAAASSFTTDRKNESTDQKGKANVEGFDGATKNEQ